MQRLIGLVRRCTQDYNMIAPGDRIGVGVSGGKDSIALLVFLAHDLKTPLTSVVAYLTMLDSYKDMPEEERERYTNIALEKSIRLGELINEFFEITKFGLQEIVLEPVELNLSMMLEQVADEIYGVLQEKNLTCEIAAEENLFIQGDPDKLARVFDNILKILIQNILLYSL